MKPPCRAFDDHRRFEWERSAIAAVVLLEYPPDADDILFAPTVTVGLVDGNEYGGASIMIRNRAFRHAMK
jgi:hypothetical protein